MSQIVLNMDDSWEVFVHDTILGHNNSTSYTAQQVWLQYKRMVKLLLGKSTFCIKSNVFFFMWDSMIVRNDTVLSSSCSRCQTDVNKILSLELPMPTFSNLFSSFLLFRQNQPEIQTLDILTVYDDFYKYK